MQVENDTLKKLVQALYGQIQDTTPRENVLSDLPSPGLNGSPASLEALRDSEGSSPTCSTTLTHTDSGHASASPKENTDNEEDSEEWLTYLTHDRPTDPTSPESFNYDLGPTSFPSLPFSAPPTFPIGASFLAKSQPFSPPALFAVLPYGPYPATTEMNLPSVPPIQSKPSADPCAEILKEKLVRENYESFVENDVVNGDSVMAQTYDVSSDVPNMGSSLTPCPTASIETSLGTWMPPIPTPLPTSAFASTTPCDSIPFASNVALPFPINYPLTPVSDQSYLPLSSSLPTATPSLSSMINALPDPTSPVFMVPNPPPSAAVLEPNALDELCAIFRIKASCCEVKKIQFSLSEAYGAGDTEEVEKLLQQAREKKSKARVKVSEECARLRKERGVENAILEPPIIDVKEGGIPRKKEILGKDIPLAISGVDFKGITRDELPGIASRCNLPLNLVSFFYDN